MNAKTIVAKQFDRFLICITVCAVFSIIVTGKVAVEQSGKQMIDGAQYASVELHNNEKTIDIRAGEQVFSFDKAVFEFIRIIGSEIKFTPFGAFVKTVGEIVPSA